MLRNKLSRRLDQGGETSQPAGMTQTKTTKRRRVKPTRKIELNWKHDGKLVWPSFGGGKRKVDIPQETKKQDILNVAIDLFFPNGKSRKAKLSDCNVELTDFKEEELPDDITVSDCYDMFKIGMLTFYLSTKTKQVLVYPRESGEKCMDSDEELPDNSVSDVLVNTQATVTSASVPNAMSASSVGTVIPPQSILDPSTAPSGQYQSTPISTTEATTSEGASLVQHAAQAAGILWESDPILHTSLAGDSLPDINPPDIFQYPDLSDAEIAFNLNFGSQQSSPSTHSSDDSVKTLSVHRGNIFKELVQFAENLNFEEGTYELKIIGTNGKVEAAEDSGGVFRDGITEFLDTFYIQYCIGAKVKVPAIRHDMDENKWVAVAKVLSIAWRQENIFPVYLALPFMSSCLYGKTLNLEQSYLNYLPEMDRAVLNEAIKNFGEVDQDDLWDILSRREVKVLVTDKNIDRVLSEMAHRDLVQVPSFVSKMWEEPLRKLNITEERLREMYQKLIPKARSVLKILKFPSDLDKEGTTVCDYLKEFIRGLDSTVLRLFMRFCTGSDLMVRPNLTVRVVKIDVKNTGDGLACTPAAHTCGCILDIPKAYGTVPFVEFQAQFTTLLTSRYWQMDIVWWTGR